MPSHGPQCALAGFLFQHAPSPAGSFFKINYAMLQPNQPPLSKRTAKDT
jgi:hypothetical protein